MQYSIYRIWRDYLSAYGILSGFHTFMDKRIYYGMAHCFYLDFDNCLPSKQIS